MVKGFFMNKTFKLIIMVFWVFVLSGCTISNHKNSQSVAAQAKYNVHLLSNKLALYGASVYRGTDSLKIVLPNKEIFTKKSANFTGKGYEIMDLVFNLTNYYKESTIAVTGYSKGDDEISIALAMERARRVMKRLWQAKIDSNFVYASSKNTGVIGGKHSLIDCTLIEVKY